MKEKINNKTTKMKKKSFKLERIFCAFVAILFLVLLVLCFFMKEFIPATLITLSLELFCVAYVISERNEKSKKIYIMFAFGVVILLTAIFYTLSVIK